MYTVYYHNQAPWSIWQHSVWIRTISTNTGPTDSTHIVIEPWYNYVQIIVAYVIKLLREWVLNFNAVNFPTRISGLHPQLLFPVIVLELFAIFFSCVFIMVVSEWFYYFFIFIYW